VDQLLKTLLKVSNVTKKHWKFFYDELLEEILELRWTLSVKYFEAILKSYLRLTESIGGLSRLANDQDRYARFRTRLLDILSWSDDEVQKLVIHNFLAGSAQLKPQRDGLLKITNSVGFRDQVAIYIEELQKSGTSQHDLKSEVSTIVVNALLGKLYNTKRDTRSLRVLINSFFLTVLGESESNAVSSTLKRFFNEKLLATLSSSEEENSASSIFLLGLKDFSASLQSPHPEEIQSKMNSALRFLEDFGYALSATD